MKSALSWIAVGAIVLLAACSGGPPTIESFTADKSEITLGDAVVLTWSVKDAKTLTLNGAAVTGTTATLTPTQTTQFVLTATNDQGTVSSASVGVTVHNVAGGAWSFYGPSNYSNGTLTVDIPSLGTDERLAILAMNLGTTDADPANPVPNATIAVSGVSPSVAPVQVAQTTGTAGALLAPSALLAPTPSGEDAAPWMARHAAAMKAHELLRARETRVLADARVLQQQGQTVGAPSPLTQALIGSTQPPSTTTFCVQQGIAPGAAHVRKSATLKKTTAHALVYLDDDDASSYAPYETGTSTDIWNQLGSLWESTIYPADTQTFGAESDVDQNGKLIILISKELGAPDSQGRITMGYYWAGDVVSPGADLTANCDTTDPTLLAGSNHADMFYLNSFVNLEQANYLDTQVIATEYPDTLGHEFQHLINFNQKHILPNDYATAEDTWINEGLSVTAEDIIGFGWNTSGGRSVGNALLTDQAYTPGGSNPYLRYYNASLFNWSGDPVGDYQGAHTFFRYFADRVGPGVLGQIVQTSKLGTSNLAQVLGEPFDQAFAESITALMFSNEGLSTSTSFDFTGSNWDPLHQKLTASTSCSAAFPYPNRPGYVQYEPLAGSANAVLRSGGWNAFVTNPGTGQAVRLTVTPTASGVQPAIAVVRFSGTLPDGRQAACPFK